MKSMTGYGSATGKVGRGRLYVELKTINHRYCDIILRIPPRMGALDASIRQLLQKHFVRGKGEIFLKEVEPVFGEAELVVNTSLAKQYNLAFRKIGRTLDLKSRADLLEVVGLAPFLETREKEGNYLTLWPAVRQLIGKGIRQLEQMRAKEGKHLLADQKKRLKALSETLDKIKRRVEKKSTERKKQLILLREQNGQENNILTDKMDVTEEVIRLKSHVDQYAGLLKRKEPAGRKLDFLIQEMHREVNTIGAKAADAPVSRYIVDAKALLENLREQVQNII